LLTRSKIGASFGSPKTRSKNNAHRGLDGRLATEPLEQGRRVGGGARCGIGCRCHDDSRPNAIAGAVSNRYSNWSDIREA
jgi:hypothetical protein